MKTIYKKKIDKNLGKFSSETDFRKAKDKLIMTNEVEIIAYK